MKKLSAFTILGIFESIIYLIALILSAIENIIPFVILFTSAFVVNLIFTIIAHVYEWDK
jgi:uncharacterized membrane protein